MNIAINTLPLSTEHRMRGTGVYTQNLIDALKRYEKKHTYTFFTRVEDIAPGSDVVHYPFFDPFFLTLPLRKPFPTMVTVHDMIPLIFPDKFPPGVRGHIKWEIQKFSLSGAKAIVTDSKCSRKDIIKITGRKSASVYVVPLAPSPQYQRVTSESILKKARDRYRISDRFVLYIGDVNWNKNVTGLLRIWKMIKSKKNAASDCQLVLAGSAFTNPELSETREILRLSDTLGISKSIVRPGFIKNEDMAAIYSAAHILVLPSWYEGFGFPVLEAMACGAPVVVSNRGSVPEIAGPATLADPADIGDFASNIIRLLRMPANQRNVLIKKGREWAKTYSWARVARETVAAYEQLGRKE